MSNSASSNRRTSRRSVLASGASAALLGATAIQAQEAIPVNPKRPPVQSSTLSNGLRLLCRQNNSSEIVSIVCMIRAGLPDERDDQAGVAALTSQALLRGTTLHSGASFEALVGRAGGNLSAAPGFDLTEIALVTSRETFDNALKLIAEVVSRPKFDAAEVATVRAAVIKESEEEVQEFAGGSYRALQNQLYPTSPYGRPVMGYAETLAKLTDVEVRKFWEQTYTQGRMTVAIVGDVDPAKAVDAAEKAFAAVPYRPGVSRIADFPLSALSRPRKEVLERPSRDPGFSQLMVGFLAPGVTREDYPVISVLDAIIGGGKQSRLFTNIRGKLNVGYALGSDYQPLTYQSHFFGYVITPSHRMDPKGEAAPKFILNQVEAALIGQYRSLATTPVTDAELVRGRNFAAGSFALRRDKTRDQAKWLAWNVAMGLGMDFDDYFAVKVAAVTKEQVQAMARKCLTNYALVMALSSQPPDQP
jgi:zinc protease